MLFDVNCRENNLFPCEMMRANLIELLYEFIIDWVEKNICVNIQIFIDDKTSKQSLFKFYNNKVIRTFLHEEFRVLFLE